MKISGSDLVLSFEGNFKQMDVSSGEKTENRIIRQNSRSSEDFPANPQMRVDRISISQNQAVEYQSNYSARVSGKTSVISTASADTIDHEQQSAMERLVGGIMDRDVIMRTIQKEEDIPLSQEKPKESPGSAGTSAQNRFSDIWMMSLRKTDIHFEAQDVNFSALGEVTTEDGQRIQFSLDIFLNRTFLSRTEQETLVQKWQERVDLTDPLVISLDGKAPQLSNARFEFDLNSDGKMENISFAAQGSGFLAFDKNNDHQINNGSELFGPGTGNGFEELAVFDEDQNNWIDENDAVFSKLSVWTKDEKGNDRLISLKDAGIGAISLDYAATLFNMTESDNTVQGQLKSTGVFLFENGQIGSVHQIDLASLTLDETVKNAAGAPQEEAQEPPANIPGRFFRAGMTKQPQAGSIASPLKDLLDRIKKLKEEMGRLLERMTPASHQERVRPYRRLYDEGLKINASALPFNSPDSLVRKESRWA